VILAFRIVGIAFGLVGGAVSFVAAGFGFWAMVQMFQGANQ
jgi:hypothetical protein